jgi:7-carboxy-7-deazaguanine synthase
MYSVKEIFKTIQGEGRLTGRVAVFVRFSGCNIWSGREQDRKRDSILNTAACPTWCDTDFRGGKRYNSRDLVAAISNTCADAPLVVFTGGEPLLQLDDELVRTLRADIPNIMIAVETNGSVEMPLYETEIDWVCVSPKQPPDQLKLLRGSELKVVVPAYDPLDYEAIATGFLFKSVSPCAVNGSLPNLEEVQVAINFCMDNPSWDLSIQTHKYLGLA